jgi:hypothetical protein
MGKTSDVPEENHQSAAIDTSKPFPCFALPENAEPITLDQVLEAEDS